MCNVLADGILSLKVLFRELAVFSIKCWNCRHGKMLIESTTLFHAVQVMVPSHLTVLAAESEGLHPD